MSNTVDVLLIDGPKDRTFVNVPRPVPPQLTVAVDDGTDAVYTVAQVDYNDQMYWVAVVDTETTTNIADVIVEMKHQPAWDLNR